MDSVSINNKVTRRRAMNASLLALKTAGVKGVMVNVWWGIVEKGGPHKYDWDGYKDLIDMVKQYGLKVQALMSFHQCPSNEDSCL
jgi:beta-amylase